MIGKLTKFFSRGGAPSGPRVHLAAFGKHPGWDDHIDDVGVDTERLVWLKKTLYIDGISQNIDSAGWEQLNEQQLLATFDHRFLWRWPGESAVGLMWSSSDGKGRKRYPMVVCLSGTGVSSGWLCEVGLPGLVRLRQRCLDAATAQGVRDGVAEVSQQLQAAATAAGPSTDVDPDADLLAAMAGRAQDPADRLAMTRVLYQIDQKMANFKTDVPKGRTRSIDMTARQFRVPLIGDQSMGMATARAWQAVALDLLGTDAALAAGVVGIEAIGGGHADLIVGQPSPRNFFCLRAAQAIEPMTTDIPFGIEPLFEEQVGRTIDRWRTRGRPEG
ncbi:MAG: hypothetical protein AABZ53_01250 [Planctomycetota bacterium]